MRQLTIVVPLVAALIPQRSEHHSQFLSHDLLDRRPHALVDQHAERHGLLL